LAGPMEKREDINTFVISNSRFRSLDAKNSQKSIKAAKVLQGGGKIHLFSRDNTFVHCPRGGPARKGGGPKESSSQPLENVFYIGKKEGEKSMVECEKKREIFPREGGESAE